MLSFWERLEEATGPAFLLVLAGAGIYLTVRLGFFQLLHFPAVWRETFGRLFRKSGGEKKQGTISPFQATATALAGTLGTGNIAGVATAMVSGGPGAVVWMGISSVFSMALKFSEIVLAVRYRQKNRSGELVGGPMYYIEKGMGSRWLAVLFAVLCAAASFGIGNLAQSNAVAGAMLETFGIPKVISGTVTMVLTGLVLCGGIQRIARLTERVVPVMAAVYLLAAIGVLVCNAEKLPGNFALMLREAFQVPAVSGGVLGFLVSRSVRLGLSRGVFSNEAGMGSAPIVHGAAHTDSAVRQGFWGVIEVFLDTTVMCTVTALVILASGDLSSGLNGAALTASAFESALGGYASSFVSVSIFFFASASILGWSYYGEKAIEYLTPKRGYRLLYRCLYLCAVLVGALISLEAVWGISDLLNLLMAVPNIAAVLVLSTTVVQNKREYFKNSKK